MTWRGSANRVFLRLALVLAAFAASTHGIEAQSTARGTGQEGCYFGDCGDDDAPPADETNRPPDPVPPPSQARDPLACVTPYGSCLMADQRGPEGAYCHCPGLGGLPYVDGRTQRTFASAQPPPAYASICATPGGACAMGEAIPIGSVCFCPTMFGPVMGIGQ